MRLLAAIMFADMVGYTRLMQQNEPLAKALRDRQRRVLEKWIKKHNGQVMQYYGDGTLSMFSSAYEAVLCATKIQQELKNDPKVSLRVGIHIGDVVYDDEGVYGDAVNIAARVQALAATGGIMISDKVFNEIRNQPGVRVESFGSHQLKNVFDPVGIYAIASEGLVVPRQDDIRELTGNKKKSVAVLPFVNMSSDTENEYFSDGITEEIINSLVRVSGLYVASRTSSFSYKNKTVDIREIGKELNVSTVLEGSVRRFGNRIRVTAQLIKTEDGFHIWSEVFDREIKDIFAVQDEIAQHIAEKLEDNFSIEYSKFLYESDTDSVDAYNFYLQGLYHWNKTSPENIFKAIEYYTKAIEKCTTYTKAYSGLANCYTYLGTIGHLDPKVAYVKAQEYATCAIEINPNLADCYVALGNVNLFYNKKYELAEANLRRAITMEPENPLARQALGVYYRIIGRYDKMVMQHEFAVRIEPLSLIANLELAMAYWVAEKFKKSEDVYHKIIDLDPNYRPAYEGLALLYLSMNKHKEAIEAAHTYTSMLANPGKISTNLGYVYARVGEPEKAKLALDFLKEREKENPHLNLTLDRAVIYAALGENDKAFDALFQAVSDNLGSVLLFLSMEAFVNLRKDTRYESLISKLGLPMQASINISTAV